MILHTINKSPYDYQVLSQCIALCRSADAILLLENGVYGMQHALIQALDQQNIQVYALEADVRARGISQIPACIQQINYAQFVTLCIEHPKQVAW